MSESADFRLPALRAAVATLHAPLLLAPVAHQQLAHPDGELASACAAAAMGVGMVVSTLSSTPIEPLAACLHDSGGLPPWFQLYAQPHRDDTLALIHRAEQAGCAALVLTVDAPVQGPEQRHAEVGDDVLDQQQRLRPPPGLLGQGAFQGCGLTSVTFPAGLTEIESEAFESCNRLTAVSIPGSAECKFMSFRNCKGLKKVTIGERYKSTPYELNGIFMGCSFVNPRMTTTPACVTYQP